MKLQWTWLSFLVFCLFARTESFWEEVKNFAFETFYGGFNNSPQECCATSHGWINTKNSTGLQHALNKYLFGQHLANSVVPKVLESHFSLAEPKKALVMSFHGLPGTGKNYLAKFIKNSIYKLGEKSQYVHMFLSKYHFPDNQRADIYKLNMLDWIRGNVSECERSLFIFDEIDKMPLGVLDGIAPFIDFHEAIDGVDYRKSVFIFLSNTGGPAIIKRMLDMWREGKKREDIIMTDMEQLVERGAFNEGGLQNSNLIYQGLIDYYIPFFPLERKHVELCIRDEFRHHGETPSYEIVVSILDELTYFPPDTKLYSSKGCRPIYQKVIYAITKERSTKGSLYD